MNEDTTLLRQLEIWLSQEDRLGKGNFYCHLSRVESGFTCSLWFPKQGNDGRFWADCTLAHAESIEAAVLEALKKHHTETIRAASA